MKLIYFKSNAHITGGPRVLYISLLFLKSSGVHALVGRGRFAAAACFIATLYEGDKEELQPLHFLDEMNFM